MALSKEVHDELGCCLAQTNLGNLLRGDKEAHEKGMVFELLRNQFCILQVLAEMNDMNSNPKAYKHLLPDPDA